MSEHNTPFYTIPEHNIPRLFTPPIIENYTDINNELTLPILKSVIKKQQDIIDRHDVELDILKTSLQEIRLILNGRQFMNRSVSFESNEPEVESTI
jgi:hypothetical protein